MSKVPDRRLHLDTGLWTIDGQTKNMGGGGSWAASAGASTQYLLCVVVLSASKTLARPNLETHGVHAFLVGHIKEKEIKVMAMQLSAYNGWENRFTWLMHLHLSSEQGLMLEITDLVATVPGDEVAGWRLAMWVKTALENWLRGFVGRAWSHYDVMQLLIWDLVGTALAYSDWGVLVRLLIGENVSTDNLFTLTLYQYILGYPEWQEQFSALLQVAPGIYACADALKDWLREMVDTWMDTPSARFQLGSPVVGLVFCLLANTYEVICWQHVARAFRPG
jgi:hypothetical protein